MSQNDVFSRVTIHGSVDDIHRKKIPIEFESVFPTEIDSEKPYIVFIEGRPGAGKSTLITKASTDWANKEILQNVEIFILVRLRRLKDKLTLEDLFGIYCPQAINDRQRFISDVVKNILLTGGKGVCLAFDGLDEYRTLSESDNLIRKLIDGQILPNASIYMLSRPAGSHWLRSSKRLTHNIEIIGFSKKEIQNYIIDYYEAEPTKAQALLKYLQDHPNNIEQMCNIPLHLATIVSLYDLGPKLLPETETDLYDKFVLYTLYRAIQPETKVDDGDDFELYSYAQISTKKNNVFKGICKLAFEATCHQQQVFTDQEIMDSGYEFPTEPGMRSFDSPGLLMADEITSETSLSAKTFSFFHLTVQEFLAAVYLTEYTDEARQLELINKLGGSIHMWVVWKFYCGLNAKKASKIFANAFKTLTKHNISDCLHHLHLIHCASESQRQELCVEILNQLNGSVGVSDIELKPSDCAALGEVFSKAPQALRQLDLSYCKIGPVGMQILSEKVTQILPKIVILR